MNRRLPARIIVLANGRVTLNYPERPTRRHRHSFWPPPATPRVSWENARTEPP